MATFNTSQLQTALQDETVIACMAILQTKQSEKKSLELDIPNIQSRINDSQTTMDSMNTRLVALNIEIAATETQLTSDIENAL
jgi:septal ring factor EnvC (AmiA/AmiB activator)